MARCGSGASLERRRLLLGLLAVPVLASCSDDRDTFLVLAASSLQPALDPINEQFQAAYGFSVRASYEGSQRLAAQIQLGAPAEVFISADPDASARSGDSNPFAGRPIAANRVTVATAVDNPARLQSAFELGRLGLRLAMAGPRVPLGIASRKTLASMAEVHPSRMDFSASVLANVISHDQSARAVLSRLLLGEADAGFVFSSYLKSVDDLGPVLGGTAPHAAAITYLANHLGTRRAGTDYLQYLGSEQARATLVEYGFAIP